MFRAAKRDISSSDVWNIGSVQTVEFQFIFKVEFRNDILVLCLVIIIANLAISCCLETQITGILEAVAVFNLCRVQDITLVITVYLLLCKRYHCWRGKHLCTTLVVLRREDVGKSGDSSLKVVVCIRDNCKYPIGVIGEFFCSKKFRIVVVYAFTLIIGVGYGACIILIFLCCVVCTSTGYLIIETLCCVSVITFPEIQFTKKHADGNEETACLNFGSVITNFKHFTVGIPCWHRIGRGVLVWRNFGDKLLNDIAA